MVITDEDVEILNAKGDSGRQLQELDFTDATLRCLRVGGFASALSNLCGVEYTRPPREWSTVDEKVKWNEVMTMVTTLQTERSQHKNKESQLMKLVEEQQAEIAELRKWKEAHA